ncbi:MAG: hypothetical protein AB1556_11790 [Bacillota bacterium]
MKKLLFFLIFSSLFLQGCIEKVSNTSNQTFKINEHTVPFLTKSCDERAGQYNFYKGVWDIEKGKLIFSNDKTIEVKGDGFDIKWDGNMNIIIKSVDNKNITIDHVETGLNIKKVNYNYNCIEVSSNNDNTETYRIVNHPNQSTQPNDYIFEVKRNGVVRTIPIKPSFDKEYTILRPLGLHIKNDRTEFYFELFYIPNESKPWEHSCAIVKGIYGGINSIDWSVVSKDIGIVEAGAGVSMVEYNENVIIAEQNGRLKQLKLEDGSIKELEIYNTKIEQFHKKYVHSSYYNKPPELYRYKDFLIVKDEPAILGSQPVVYILAAKEDKIIGEIIANGKRITVFKDGIVTEKKSLESRYQPFTWVFPGV